VAPAPKSGEAPKRARRATPKKKKTAKA
jgi:hypothetical protein